MSTDGGYGDLRAQIDRLDAEILRLLTERGRAAQAIGARKSVGNQAVYAPHREQEVLARLRALNTDGVYPDAAIEAVFREIISASRALEEPLRVAYLGPEASYTHLASHQHFGTSTQLIARATQEDVFREVERKGCHYGVVPVENSTMGVVIDTLDLFAPSSLQVCAEIIMPVSHALLSNSALDEIERVYSKEQAFAQCRRWLSERLPRAERVAMSSTSEAARRAATDPGAAAISSGLAAELYGLDTVEDHIEDDADNVTRFFVIGHHSAEPTGRDKTSIRFAIRDEVGALVHVLERFQSRGLNLSSIESRPSRLKSWDYVFYVDVAGHVKDEPVRAALSEVAEHCLSVKVLGSYPRA